MRVIHCLGVGVNASIPKFPLIPLDLQEDICYNRLTCSLSKEGYKNMALEETKGTLSSERAVAMLLGNKLVEPSDLVMLSSMFDFTEVSGVEEIGEHIELVGSAGEGSCCLPFTTDKGVVIVTCGVSKSLSGDTPLILDFISTVREAVDKDGILGVISGESLLLRGDLHIQRVNEISVEEYLHDYNYRTDLSTSHFNLGIGKDRVKLSFAQKGISWSKVMFYKLSAKGTTKESETKESNKEESVESSDSIDEDAEYVKRLKSRIMSKVLGII